MTDRRRPRASTGCASEVTGNSGKTVEVSGLPAGAIAGRNDVMKGVFARPPRETRAVPHDRGRFQRKSSFQMAAGLGNVSAWTRVY
jgi:hypothetical protein